MITIRRGAAVAVASGAGVLIACCVPASAHRPVPAADPDPNRALTLVLTTTQQVDVDAPPAHQLVGDYSAWTDDVRQDGKLVGTTAVVCTTTRVALRGAEVSALCTVVISLPDGQLDLQGAVTQMPDGPDIPGQFAVAGGTGAYRTASGDAVATYLPNRDIKVTIALAK
jgi:hypothetical protein